jgi:hypothetical protein
MGIKVRLIENSKENWKKIEERLKKANDLKKMIK